MNKISWLLIVMSVGIYRDQKVNIRLWGDKVDQIDEDSMGRVVIVTSTTVRKLKGLYLYQSRVSSVMHVFFVFEI